MPFLLACPKASVNYTRDIKQKTLIFFINTASTMSRKKIYYEKKCPHSPLVNASTNNNNRKYLLSLTIIANTPQKSTIMGRVRSLLVMKIFGAAHRCNPGLGTHIHP